MAKPVRLSQSDLDHFYDKQLGEEAKKVISANATFLDGIQWFIDWLRFVVRKFILKELPNFSFVKNWVTSLGLEVSEFVFTVLGTLTHFLRLVFSTPEMWIKAHESAKVDWDSNEDNGHSAQVYAYGRNMSQYFLELIKQCTERAIKAHNLELKENEKQDISDGFDKLLFCQV